MTTRCLAAIILVVVAVTGAVACAANPSSSAAAEKLIALTRETQTVYSLVVWNRITRPGEPVVEEWGAEFHDRNLHRVETPRERMVADCAAMTGTYFNVVTGETIRGAKVARAACGIQANSVILSARIDGRQASQFGPVTHLVVTDAETVRTYDVAENGALLAATISDRNGGRLLTNWAVSYSPIVSGDIFSVKSLARSAVPDEFKHPPSG